MTRLHPLPLALLLLSLLALPSRSHAGEQTLTLTTALSTAYDSNFLEYSDNQLDTFKAGTHPLRFAVESTDDGIFSPGVSLTWEQDLGGGRRHALRARWDGDFHATNPGADHRSYSARWTESFTRARRLVLGYSRLNNYYVRQLRDEDLPAVAPLDKRWQRAEYTQDAATVGWRQAFTKTTTLGLGYRYEKRDYLPAFRERTSTANQALVSVDWDELPNRGDIEITAGYRALVADATDGDAVTGDDDDVSYHGLLTSITGRMDFSKKGSVRWGGDAGLDVYTRIYDSKVSPLLDPAHAGRNDLFVGFAAGLRAAWKRWDARAWFRIENNTADLGTGASPTSDSGSYKVNQFGLDLSWTGLLWSSGKASH
jgi:hypothetical protein